MWIIPTSFSLSLLCLTRGKLCGLLWQFSSSVLCFFICSCFMAEMIQVNIDRVTSILRKFKGDNLLWQPSCRYVWRWVTAPPYIFVVKPPSNFIKRELPFPRGHKSYRLLHCESSGEDNVRRSHRMIVPITKVTITYLHMWSSIWSLPHSLLTHGFKRIWFPL